MGSDGIVGMCFLANQQCSDGPLTGVICRQSQPPILEVRMQILKVLGRGLCTGFGLEPLIPGPSRGKPVLLRGCWSELEEPNRTCWAARPRVKRGFHLSDPDQLRGNTFGG